MIRDCWVLFETFFLPGCRHRLPLYYQLLSQNKIKDAGVMIVEQIAESEKLLKRKLDFGFNEKQTFSELTIFLSISRDSVMNRLNTIRLRLQQEDDPQ